MGGSVESIRPYVNEFVAFARQNPEKVFLVTPIGCGIAGYKPEDIAPLFGAALALPNVLLPETFVAVIRKHKAMNDEMKGMVFHAVELAFFPEDEVKMSTMSLEDRIAYKLQLKKLKRYTVKHDTPAPDGFNLNTTKEGYHKIAVAGRTFAIVAGKKLYTNRSEWGLDFNSEIRSVVARDGNEEKFPYGQFDVLLADGRLVEVWSDSSNPPISQDSDFVGIASGCNGVVFGLKSNGTVQAFFTERNPAIVQAIREWTNIKQIEAGPRHVMGLRRDGTVVVAGESSCYFKKVASWRNVVKIHATRSALGAIDVSYAIDESGWLYIDGYDYYSRARDNWRKIHAQYDVADVIDNCEATLVRLTNGELRFITPHNINNYKRDLDFLEKYKGFRFIEAYGPITVIVDKEGEFRVMNNFEEVNWWDIG